MQSSILPPTYPLIFTDFTFSSAVFARPIFPPAQMEQAKIVNNVLKTNALTLRFFSIPMSLFKFWRAKIRKKAEYRQSDTLESEKG